MKPALGARLAGWISMLAIALLTSPGVRVVRADEAGPISDIPAGPVCSADSTGPVRVTIALPSQEEVRERQERKERPKVVSLDGGGNRYGRAAPPAAASPDARRP